MAYQPIEEEAKFQTKLRRLEPTDPDHADTFNPLFETLLNNDVFLNQETDKVKEHCENNSVHVTTEQKEQWSQIVTPQQDGQMTKEDKLKLDGIEKGAQENQDAFGEIRIGSTSIAANKKDASITLKAGANIELKGDNSTKTLEIKAQNATDASEMTYQNPHQAGGNTTDLETVLNYIADKVLQIDTIGITKQVKGQIGVVGYSSVYANIIFQQLVKGRANLFLQGKIGSKASNVGNDFKFIDVVALKRLLELSSITWNTLQTEVTLDNLSAMAELSENDLYGYTGLKLSSCNSSTPYLNFSRQYTETEIEGAWSLNNILYNTNLYFTASIYGLSYKN